MWVASTTTINERVSSDKISECSVRFTYNTSKIKLNPYSTIHVQYLKDEGETVFHPLGGHAEVNSPTSNESVSCLVNYAVGQSRSKKVRLVG